MENGAAAAVAVGVEDVADFRRNAGVAQRHDDNLALPGKVGRRRPVLELAAAAHAEMGADGCDAGGARRLDPQQVAPVWMAGPRVDLHDLAGQRIGHVDGAGVRRGDAVAAGAETVDGETLNQMSLP